VTGPPGFRAWPFSWTGATTVPSSPFGAVVPATAQQDAHTVSTSQDVVITAAGLIAGAGRFHSWLQLFSNGGTVNGTTLTVPAGGSSVAGAFYSIPSPDPCPGRRDPLQI